jgi:NADH-quinone oxidoreductase subunit E
MTSVSAAPFHTAHQFEAVCSILDRHGRNPSRLIPILQAVQEEYRYLPEEILAYVATSLDVPVSRVYGVATFYAHFALQAKGKYVVRLCDGTACHVKNSIPILEALREKLHLTGKKATTDDFLFTVETVACLGACGLAPVMVVNDEVHGQMTPEKAIRVVDEIQARETAVPAEVAQ